MTIYAKPGTTIHIGRVGEGSATKVVFDVSKWFEDYGEGNVELVIDQNGERYPQLTATVGNEVIWEVSDSNTAEAGMGKCELVYTKVTLIGFDEVPTDWYQDWREYADQDGNQLTGNIRPTWTGDGFPYYKKHTITAKSPVYDFIVTSSLDYDEGAEPPAPYESWVERVIEDADYLRRSMPKVREAEAWAVGTIDGIEISKTASQYQNNTKYYAEESGRLKTETEALNQDTIERHDDIVVRHTDIKERHDNITELHNTVIEKHDNVVALESSVAKMQKEVEGFVASEMEALETLHETVLDTKTEVEGLIEHADATKNQIVEEVASFNGYKEEVVAAKNAALSAQQGAENAQDAAEDAKILAQNAQAGAESARAGAKSERETAQQAATVATNAKADTLALKDEALSAKNTATTAANTASTASISAEEARDKAIQAQSGAETARAGAENAQASAENAMRIAIEYSGNPAISVNGTWHIWNAEKKEYEDSGIRSILAIVKSYPSVADMQADLANREEGDLVIIASDVEQEDNSKLFVHTGTDWKYLSDLSGLQGVGIAKIERTSGNGAAGTTDTYTITLTDNRTYNFTVYNGADGEGSGDMRADVYDADGKIVASGGIAAYIEEALKNGTSAVLKSWTAEDFA